MIIKSFEVNKKRLDKKKIILLYGKNEGHKKEIINFIINDIENRIFYEEKEIIEDSNNLTESLKSKSLFEKEKVIIIKRATDKILKIVNEVKDINLDDIIIIVDAENLDKKSKLRTDFEKDKNLACIPFYPDNEQTLLKVASNFLKEKKLLISSSNINLIIRKCAGDRQNLINELVKLEYFSKKGKKLNLENISKLINLVENNNISDLVDNCLMQNKKKIENILNENNFSNDDSILILRTFLNKTKRILKLSNQFKINNNIEATLSSAKPPIFWKDKEVVKQQLMRWNPKKLKELIYKVNELELNIKYNINNSMYFINNFIFEITTSKVNN